MNSTEHMKKAEEWCETYVKRNPQASVVQIARAANNARLTIPQSLVADVRRRTQLRMIPFNPVIKTVLVEEPKVVPAQPPPEPTPAPQWPPGEDPWSKLGAVPPQRVPPKRAPFPAIVEVKGKPTLTPPPMPAVQPPEPEHQEDEEESGRGRKMGGVRRTIKQRLPMGDGSAKEVCVLVCGHAVTSFRSQLRPARLCYACGKDETKRELSAGLKKLVKLYGFDFVLEQLSGMEREEHAHEAQTAVQA